MKYSMPIWLQFLAKRFPGIRKSIAKLDDVQIADHCEFDGIKFQFDSRVMDKKRFGAIAAGALESDEIKVAQGFLKKHDILVEFGSGLGIAAARVNKTVGPQKHYCFEANPLVIEYAQKLFKINEIQIKIENYALGNGTNLPFYIVNDYILSSFQKPKGRDDWKKVDVPTIKCQEVVTSLRPTAIFCDIEGAELEYLNANDFESTEKIIVELHPQVYGVDGVRLFYKKIEKHGFKCHMKKGDTHCFIR